MPRNPITNQIKVATYASLLKESDKGCVLLAVGVFDRVLQNILEMAILSNLKRKLPKEFLEVALFGDNGTFHTFSSKINAALAFRLIPLDVYNALHVLRKLRNEAAHCYFEFTFSNPGVVGYLNKLQKYNLQLYRKMFMVEAKLEMPEKEIEKFDFVVRCYAVLMKLNDALLKQLERYVKVRGIKVPKLHSPHTAAPE